MESSGVQGAGVPQRIKCSDAIPRAGKKGGLCKTANQENMEKTIKNISHHLLLICHLCSCSAGFSLWFSDKTLDAVREVGLTA